MSAVPSRASRSASRPARTGTSAERLDEAGRLPADPPAPDDEHGLPLEPLAEHELERELPGLLPAHETVALGHAPKEREHERQRELSRGPRQHIGRIRDDDASSPRRVQIDVVHADGVVGDDLQLRAGSLEVRVVDGDGEHRHDAVGVAHRRHELEGGGERLLDLGRHPVADVDAWSSCDASSPNARDRRDQVPHNIDIYRYDVLSSHRYLSMGGRDDTRGGSTARGSTGTVRGGCARSLPCRHR